MNQAPAQGRLNIHKLTLWQAVVVTMVRAQGCLRTCWRRSRKKILLTHLEGKKRDTVAILTVNTIHTHTHTKETHTHTHTLSTDIGYTHWLTDPSNHDASLHVLAAIWFITLCEIDLCAMTCHTKSKHTNRGHINYVNYTICILHKYNAVYARWHISVKGGSQSQHSLQSRNTEWI